MTNLDEGNLSLSLSHLDDVLALGGREADADDTPFTYFLTLRCESDEE